MKRRVLHFGRIGKGVPRLTGGPEELSSGSTQLCILFYFIGLWLLPDGIQYCVGGRQLLPLLLQARGVLDPLLLLLGQRGKLCSPLFLLSSPFVEDSVWLICILIYYSLAAVA